VRLIWETVICDMLTNTSRSPRARATAAAVTVASRYTADALSPKYRPAALQGPREVPRPREVADNDLGAEGPQRVGACVLATDQRGAGKVAPAQQLDQGTPHAAHTARRSGDEDRTQVRHGRSSAVRSVNPRPSAAAISPA